MHSLRLLLLGLIFSMLAMPSQAQALDTSPTGHYTGADILFVVDQSGSMRGRADCLTGTSFPQPKASDPEGLRFQSMQAMVRWFGDFSQRVEPDVDFNVSVLAFGDPQRSVVLDWTRVPSLDSSEKEWQSQADTLEELLGPTVFGDRDFCNTNFRDALKEGQQQFDALPPLPTGERHVRAVVIITDGAPCVPSEADCGLVSAQRNHLNQVKALVDTAFPAPDYHLYLIAIDTTSYWESLGPDWLRIVPPEHAKLVTSGTEMGRAVRYVVDDIFSLVTRSGDVRDVTSELRANGYANVLVYPYLSQLQVNIFKLTRVVTSEAIAQIYTPDGQLIDPTMPEVTVHGSDGHIETWTIDVPEPGMWRVEVPNPEEVEAVIQQAYIRHRLLDFEPAVLGSVFRGQQITVSPYLFVSPITGERPIISDSTHPLEVTAIIQQPDGTNVAVPLSPGGEIGSDGTTPFATAKFVPGQAGQYRFFLCGIVPSLPAPGDSPTATCGGDRFTPLDTSDSPQSFVVEGINITLEPDPAIVAMGMKGVVGFDGVEPWCVKINSSRDPSRRVLNYEHLSAVLTIVYEDGTSEDIPLAYQEDPNAPCAFQGRVRFSKPGTARVSLRISGPSFTLTQTPLGTNDIVLVANDGVERRFQESDVPEPGPTQTIYETDTPITVEVAPLREIFVRLIQPATTDATSNVVHSVRFWEKEPLIIEFEIVDDAGNPVNINSLVQTDPPVAMQVSPAGDLSEDITGDHVLSQLGDNKFGLETTDYGPGQYVFRFIPGAVDTLRCACGYDPDSVPLTLTVSRIVPLTAPLVAIGTAIVVMSLIVLVGWLIWHEFQRRKYPLTGNLIFVRDAVNINDGRTEVSEDRVLALSHFGANTVSLSGNDLPTGWPIQRIRITNKPPRIKGLSRSGYTERWNEAREQGRLWLSVKPKRKEYYEGRTAPFEIRPAINDEDKVPLTRSRDGMTGYSLQREANN